MPPSCHVLIVDDDAGVRTVLAHVVAQLYPAATIAAATNGTEALSAVAQQHPEPDHHRLSDAGNGRSCAGARAPCAGRDHAHSAALCGFENC